MPLAIGQTPPTSFQPVASSAYFQPLGDQRYLADPATTGPWHPRLQHGGPPSALLVHAAEQAAAAARDDLVAVRLGAEFLGPVPVGEVLVETQVLRAARTAMLMASAPIWNTPSTVSSSSRRMAVMALVS